MTNAARLVAALCLALTAFIVSGQIMSVMPDGTGFGYFTYVNMLLGIVCGWKIMGKRAGRGITAAVNNGLTGAVALMFWGLFVQGSYEMFRQALRNKYGGPFDALSAIFTIAIDYGLTILVPHVVFTLLLGGILSGLATEYASRKWR